jgi:SAM-dependent methyltransferase
VLATGQRCWRAGTGRVSRSTGTSSNASQSKKARKCSTWDAARGDFAASPPTGAAHISGLDATATFIQIARERIPAGDFRVGDIEHLPWPDNSFDVITGFNSFIFAADITDALREARRVARPGANVAITVFGRPERCESTSLFGSVGQLLPAQPGPG